MWLTLPDSGWQERSDAGNELVVTTAKKPTAFSAPLSTVPTVDRSHGPSQPVPLLVIVVRQIGVGVLQQGDHNQPAGWQQDR